MCTRLMILASCVVVLGLASSACAVDDFESYWSTGDLAQNWTITGGKDVAPGTRADVTLLTGGYPTVSEGSQAMAIDFHVPGGWLSDDPCDIESRSAAGVTFTPRTPIDLSSFGPDMKAVHSPDERLNIPSTQRFNTLLKRLLEVLAG